MNLRRKRFANAVVETGNLTEAAKIAGYSERSAYNQGSRLMNDDEIRREVAAKSKRILDDDDILTELGAVATAETTIRGSDKVAALVHLAKIRGMLRDTSVTIDARSLHLEGITPDELRTLAALDSEDEVEDA